MANYKRIFIDGYRYYLTVVTHHRNPILIDNVDLLRDAFHLVKQDYIFSIDAIVILPDHFHMIILPERACDYPDIIKNIKRHFSRHCPAEFYQHVPQSVSRTKNGHKPIWQKRYYEHAIRDEQEYQALLDYIHYNPVKHRITDKPKKWKYSSFHKFVSVGAYAEDWCDYRDNINFENKFPI